MVCFHRLDTEEAIPPEIFVLGVGNGPFVLIRRIPVDRPAALLHGIPGDLSGAVPVGDAVAVIGGAARDPAVSVPVNGPAAVPFRTSRDFAAGILEGDMISVHNGRSGNRFGGVAVGRDAAVRGRGTGDFSVVIAVSGRTVWKTCRFL